MLSPEARMVVLPNRRGQHTGEVRALLDAGVDWSALIALANRERCAIPLWRSIQRTGYQGTEEQYALLGQMARAWELRQFHLERLLIRTLGAFEDAAFDALLLKGAAAAVSIYEGFPERPMIDLDILVPEEQAEAAWLRAQEIGWSWDAKRFPRAAYRDAHHLPPLHDEFGARTGLEVHTRIWMPDHPFNFSSEDVRDRAIDVVKEGCEISVPCVEHQLLHCCIHFVWSHRLSSHGWRAISDVDAFVDSGRLNWDLFVGEAKRSRAETCCYWTLRLAAVLADVTVPEQVLRELEPGGPAYLLSRLERHFVLNLFPDNRRCPSIALSNRLWRMGVKRGEGSKGISLPDAPEPMGKAARVARHLSELREWAGYISRLV